MPTRLAFGIKTSFDGNQKGPRTVKCGVCRDSGRLLEDGRFGPCPKCCVEEYAKIQKGKRLAQANIPVLFQGVTVGQYEPKTPEQQSAKKVVSDYILNLEENLSEGRGLTLWGSVGCGKTHLAVAVIVAAKELGFSAYFATEDGIFDRFKAEWNDPAEEMQFLSLLQKVRFLCIDDMGIRRPSDYVSDRYEAIVNARYANGLPTIVTTNRTPEQIAAVYERQMSRLAGNLTLKVVGPDRRKR